VPGDDAALAAAVEDGMDGDDLAILDDADLVGGTLHLDGPAPCGVGHAVKVAIHGHHAVPGDAPLQPQHGLERPGWERLQAGALLGKVLADYALRGGVGAGVGDLVEPLAELVVEVAEVAEAAGEEEVLADVAERALDLALGLGPVGLAGLGQVAVMTGELDQGAVVDDVSGVGVLAHEHGAHAVVEDLGRRPAQRLESSGMAAQQGLHVLLRHEPAPQHAAVAQHEREQPDDPLGARLVGEHGAEMGEIDLRLPTRRRLEPHLEPYRRAGPDIAQEILHHGVATAVAELADLAVQPAAGQVGVGRHALAQIGLERADLGRAGLPWSIGRRLQAALDVFAHGLAVEPGPPRDGGHAQPLPMQIQDHDELPKPDHHCSPSNGQGEW